MMGGDPLVSVVTPSFNQGRFIAQTIDSVLAQDYPRVEYLVVDGASTDNTLDALRGYGKRLRWMSEPDHGVSSAINKGWRRTQGEIIAWLNSDDTYVPGAISKAVRFLRDHPEVDLTYGDCKYIDPTGQYVSSYPTRPYDYAALVCSTSNYIPQPATFLRRHVLDEIGYLDEGLHYVMDLDFWLRLGMEHSLAYLPELLATYRLHEHSKTVASVARSGEELVRIHETLFARPNLPSGILRLKKRAMSNVHYRVANYCFMDNQIASALKHILAGWRLAPFNLHRVVLKIVLLSALGGHGPAVAARLSRDPVVKQMNRKSVVA